MVRTDEYDVLWEQSNNMGFNFEVIHSGTISTLAQKLNNLDSIKAWSDPNPYQILPIIWKNRQKKTLPLTFRRRGP